MPKNSSIRPYQHLSETGQGKVDLGHLFSAWMGFHILIGMNVFLPLFNLLPVPPLDGAKILEEVWSWLRSGDRPPWEQDPDWWKRG
jgi:membrane-associated protease RseP (regulator of RpoE activity)